MDFTQSQPLSIGIELELQLINLNDYNLSQDASELLRRLETITFKGAIKPEITQSMIELNSSIHQHPDTMLNELLAIKDELVGEARKIDIGICGGGTHPFQKWQDRKIYPTERFSKSYKKYGYLAKQFTVFGQHIHIGCHSGDMAIRLTHAFIRYMPHFIALSAASPFYQQEDSDFVSTRLNIISAFPTSGILPKEINTWRDFTAYYNKLLSLGVIHSIKDLYWDIRPKPEYGTVEIRICDTPLQLTTAIYLAAYAQALANLLMSNELVETVDDLALTYKYNRFQAGKYGLAAKIIVADGEITIKDDIKRTLLQLKPFIKQLKLEDYLNTLQDNIDRDLDADWLRNKYAEVGTFPDLVRHMIARW